ncbi:MAG: hypothetical protein OXC13_10750 [Caldilineaceae bacterium]|nr:hypothetical protein [Caldilineaceae bacterium]
MDDFLPERQTSGKPGTQVSVWRAKFAFLLAVLLCTALIAVGCGTVPAPVAEPEDDPAVPEAAAAEQEGEAAADREPAAEEAAVPAESSEPAEAAEVAEADPEPASEPAPDEVVAEDPPDWTTHAFVDGGYYVLGNPEAEVSILDAGDFL